MRRAPLLSLLLALGALNLSAADARVRLGEALPAHPWTAAFPPEAREVIVVQSTVMLIIVFTIAVNLLVDLLYGLLDPRVRTAR